MKLSPDKLDKQKTVKGDSPSIDEGSTIGIDTTVADLIRQNFPQLEIGEKIGLEGRYVIKEQLGRGGMGIVYKAWDEVGQVDVAIKLLPLDVSRNGPEMEELRKNYRIVQKLSHPNIVQLKTLERISESGGYFLVMEFVPGGYDLNSLRKKYLGMKVPVKEAVNIAEQVAAALDYSHRQGVIHRDIKPGNILILPSGDIKVTDFGIAGEIHSKLNRLAGERSSISGTRSYMAPEQWEGKEQDGGTDQWGLAVVLYQLISGKLPFNGETLEKLKHQVLNSQPVKLKSLTHPQNAAFKKALSKKKENRFETCSEFINALKGKGFLKRVPMLYGLAVVLVVATGIAGFFLLNKEPSYQSAVTLKPILKPGPVLKSDLVISISELIDEIQSPEEYGAAVLEEKLLEEGFDVSTSNILGETDARKLGDKHGARFALIGRATADYIGSEDVMGTVQYQYKATVRLKLAETETGKTIWTKTETDNRMAGTKDGAARRALEAAANLAARELIKSNVISDKTN